MGERVGRGVGVGESVGVGTGDGVAVGAGDGVGRGEQVDGVAVGDWRRPGRGGWWTAWQWEGGDSVAVGDWRRSGCGDRRWRGSGGLAIAWPWGLATAWLCVHWRRGGCGDQATSVAVGTGDGVATEVGCAGAVGSTGLAIWDASMGLGAVRANCSEPGASADWGEEQTPSSMAQATSRPRKSPDVGLGTPPEPGVIPRLPL